MRIKRYISIFVVILISFSTRSLVRAEKDADMQTQRYYYKDTQGNDIADKWFEYYRLTEENERDSNDELEDGLAIVSVSENFGELLEIPPKIGTADIKHVFIYNECQHITTVKLSNITETVRIVIEEENSVLPSVKKMLVGDAFDFALSNNAIELRNLPFLNENKWYTCVMINTAETYEVLPECTQYIVKDGVVFSPDGTTLIKFPAMKKQETYKLPEGIRDIDVRAFEDTKKLNEVICCNSIEQIGDAAFKGSNIKNIVLNEKLGSIGAQAFALTKRLNKIIIPQDVAMIDESAFSESGITKAVFKTTSLYLKDIAEGDVIISKPQGWFSGCNKLKKVVLPNNIKKIPNSTFTGCISLEKISLPKSVSKIGISAFSYCKSLKAVDIPSKVRKIPRGAFSGCTKLSKVKFREGLEKIGWGAFRDCKNIRKITFPSTLISVWTDAFYNCSKLKRVIVSDKKTGIARRAICWSEVRVRFGNESLREERPNKGAVIIGPKNSLAHNYAKKNKIKFKKL